MSDILITHLRLANLQLFTCWHIYTGCNRRNGPDFGRVFLMLYYTDITQNTYIQSWTVTEIIANGRLLPRRPRLFQSWGAIKEEDYNLMEPPSYMQSFVDRNTVRQCMTIHTHIYLQTCNLIHNTYEGWLISKVSYREVSLVVGRKKRLRMRSVVDTV